MKKFKDVSLANNELRKLYIEIIKKLCPVFKTTCKKEECMSFYKGEIIKTVYDEYRLYEPMCNYALIYGKIKVERE